MTHASSAATLDAAPHRPPPRPAGSAGNSVAMLVALWAAVVVIAGLEVLATYRHPPMPALIATLLALAAVQAFLGLMFFMHLRHERAMLGWTLVGVLLFVLALMNMLWPDALRVFRLRLHE